MKKEEQIPDACHPEQANGDLARRKQELNAALIQQALEQDDPMRASLQVSTAELMDMASLIKGSIHESFNASTNSVEALKAAGPAFEQLHKCFRQADRFMHLDVLFQKPEKYPHVQYRVLRRAKTG